MLFGGICAIAYNYKIGPIVQRVFVSGKLEQDFRPKEVKPSVVNQQCIVYHFSRDLCDADYVGYTTRHLFQRVTEAHGDSDLWNENCIKVVLFRLDNDVTLTSKRRLIHVSASFSVLSYF